MTEAPGRKAGEPADRIRLTPRGIATLVALVGCSVAILSGVTFTPPGIAGTWFEEIPDDRRLVQLLHRFGAAGDYESVWRALEGCRVMDEGRTVGRWEQEGQDLRLRFARPDGAAGAPVPFATEWLGASQMRLAARADGLQISGMRVPPDFTFPPPIGCAETPPATRRRV